MSAYAYHAPKKMPTLDSLTAAKPVVRIQTPEQMKAVFAAMRSRRTS